MKMPDIKLERAQSEHPVPSHGGPCVGVEWKLTINGVLIGKEYNRYPWAYSPTVNAKQGAKPPSHLAKMYEELIKSFEE